MLDNKDFGYKETANDIKRCRRRTTLTKLPPLLLCVLNMYTDCPVTRLIIRCLLSVKDTNKDSLTDYEETHCKTSLFISLVLSQEPIRTLHIQPQDIEHHASLYCVTDLSRRVLFPL